MVEQISGSSAATYERDGLPIRLFEPELDALIDETARQIATGGEDGIAEVSVFNYKLLKGVFELRVLAARTHSRQTTEFADNCQFLCDATREAIERAKEILVAEGRDEATALRKLKDRLEQRAGSTSPNQGI